MGWVVVPNLLEGRTQLNNRFPNRAKNAEGTIGDTSHKGSPSSHNPDETGVPEYSDHDGIDEVRAADFDKNLNDSNGYTMEMMVQRWITLARSGLMPWLRYLIYNKRIWHKRDNFVTRAYTGSDTHENHAHVNSDFTQWADTVTGTDWHMPAVGDTGGGVVVVADKTPRLVVDDELGPKTISRWQQVMKTPVDGVISRPSELVKAVQRRLNAQVGAGLVVDGDGIRQDGHFYRTTRALQRYLGTPQDGVMSSPKSEVVKAVQRRLNENWF